MKGYYFSNDSYVYQSLNHPFLLGFPATFQIVKVTTVTPKAVFVYGNGASYHGYVQIIFNNFIGVYT